MIAAGARSADLGGGDAVRDDLGVDVQLAHPPGDELRVLRTEVDDEHGVIGRICWHRSMVRGGCRAHAARDEVHRSRPARCGKRSGFLARWRGDRTSWIHRRATCVGRLGDRAGLDRRPRSPSVWRSPPIVSRRRPPPSIRPPVRPTATSDPGSLASNPFIPEDVNIGDCVSSLPRPDCGSKEQSGYHQYLTLIVLFLATAFIGWRIARSVRSPRPGGERPTAAEDPRLQGLGPGHTDREWRASRSPQKATVAEVSTCGASHGTKCPQSRSRNGPTWSGNTTAAIRSNAG